MSKTCIQLPHGIYGLIVSALTTAGWIAALFENSCNYALVSGDIVNAVSVQDVPFLQVGQQAYRLPLFNTDTSSWYVSKEGQCITYPTTVVFDLPWRISSVCSFIGLVMGGGATFYLWISIFCRFTRGSWRWAGYEVVAASFFQLLAFVWFATEICQNNNCQLSFGSKSDVIAALLWFIAAILIFAHYPKPKDSTAVDGVMKTSSKNGREQQRQRSKGTVMEAKQNCQESKSDEEIGPRSID